MRLYRLILVMAIGLGAVRSERPEERQLTPFLVGVTDIRDRLISHGRESYTVLFNVMKSVSVALAVLAIGKVVHGGEDTFARAVLVGASIMGVAMTYVGTTIGSNLLPGRFGPVDAVLPLLLTAAEGWPFLLLSGESGDDPFKFVVRAWLISMGVFNLIAAALLLWVRRRMRRRAYTTDAWTSIIVRYRCQLLQDLLQASLMGVVLVVAGVFSGEMGDGRWLACVAGGLTIVGYVFGLRGQNAVARRLSLATRV
jgi:hypothetical protein